MSDTYTTGIQGAKRASFETFSFRSLIRELIDQNPTASREAIQSLFNDAVRDDDRYLTSILEYAFSNAWNALGRDPTAVNDDTDDEVDTPKIPRRSRKAPKTEAQKQADKATFIERMQAAGAQQERAGQLTLLDEILPTGVKVRFARLQDWEDTIKFYDVVAQRRMEVLLQDDQLCDAQTQSRYSKLIAARFNGDRTVMTQDVITDDQAYQLREQAQA